MSKAALQVYRSLAADGHQRAVLENMQTREDLYEVLGYHEFEQKLDRLFAAEARTVSNAD